MKIGIYAGTFDPVHEGHVQFALSATQNAKLDRVILVAEKNPYRKKPHASWDHRQAMIERATEELPTVDHNYQFAAELAHQHTMQNLLNMAEKHYGLDNEFWFLVGSDVFNHMHEWQDILQNHEYGGFIVSLRDEHSHAWLEQKRAWLKERSMDPHCVVLDNKKPHISSSAIRDAVQNHQPLHDVSRGVADYIQAHGLYNSPAL